MLEVFDVCNERKALQILHVDKSDDVEVARGGNKDACFRHGVGLAGLGFLPIPEQIMLRQHLDREGTEHESGMMAGGPKKTNYKTHLIHNHI